MKPGTFKYLPPTLALILMLGLTIESYSRPKPADAEPFHQKLRALSEKIPKNIGDWVGTDMEVYKSATKLLNPNFILQRNYIDETRKLAVTFLIVQCRDARDMGGHYPLNCYPSQGYKLIQSDDKEWTLPNGLIIKGKTYKFSITRYSSRSEMPREEIIDVDSIMIVPNEGCVTTIDGVRDAAASLTRRFFGAAQIQVVHNDLVSPEDRAKISDELLQANQFIIEALMNTNSHGGSR